MSQCNETFDKIAHQLGGFSCSNAPAIVHLRNPLSLTNWTLPVLELMMVFGAALALWWSLRRLRRDNDPTNLALWIASIVYLLATEIPLYFPDRFGMQDRIGVVFDHNVFTVQFLYERLPLYIVALYPAVVTLAFEIVRVLGVFSRRHGLSGIVAGAVCVGFVHQCFYEVFDQLGPQLRWWQWNTGNPINHPMFASVPMTSVFIFATLGPAVLTFLVMWLVGRHVAPGKALGGSFGIPSLAWRTAAAGLLVPLGVAILSVPSSLFSGHVGAQAVVFAVELAVFALTAAPTLVRRWLFLRHAVRHGHANPAAPNVFLGVFGPVYLGVLAALWVSALPGYFGAEHGITSDATPTGCLPYAALCFVLAAAWEVMGRTAGRHPSAKEAPQGPISRTEAQV
jgi:hypothetical protein